MHIWCCSWPTTKPPHIITAHMLKLPGGVKSVPVTTVLISTVYLDLLPAQQPALAQRSTPAQVDRVSQATKLADCRNIQPQAAANHWLSWPIWAKAPEEILWERERERIVSFYFILSNYTHVCIYVKIHKQIQFYNRTPEQLRDCFHYLARGRGAVGSPRSSLSLTSFVPRRENPNSAESVRNRRGLSLNLRSSSWKAYRRFLLT